VPSPHLQHILLLPVVLRRRSPFSASTRGSTKPAPLLPHLASVHPSAVASLTRQWTKEDAGVIPHISWTLNHAHKQQYCLAPHFEQRAIPPRRAGLLKTFIACVKLCQLCRVPRSTPRSRNSSRLPVAKHRIKHLPPAHTTFLCLAPPATRSRTCCLPVQLCLFQRYRRLPTTCARNATRDSSLKLAETCFGSCGVWRDATNLLARSRAAVQHDSARGSRLAAISVRYHTVYRFFSEQLA